jgi:UDP-glucose 4-epimerase
MIVLVLGSEGFIGNSLVTHFIRIGYTVIGCDLYETSARGGYKYFKVSRLSPEWEDVFTNEKYDYCINAAGSGNVPYSMTHPFADFEANTLDTIRILDAIRRHNPACRYLHISSAAVYGNPDRLPIGEDAVLHPMSPYGWHKLMSEKICVEYHTIFGVATAITRPFSVYGPGLRKQLFWDLFHKCINSNGTVELWGTGNESRDFIFIDDLVESFHLILEKAPMEGEIYNIASGTETTIARVVELFLSNLDQPPVVKFNNQVRQGDPLNWRADIGSLINIGFSQDVPIKEGVSKVIRWMKQLPAGLK